MSMASDWVVSDETTECVHGSPPLTSESACHPSHPTPTAVITDRGSEKHAFAEGLLQDVPGLHEIVEGQQCIQRELSALLSGLHRVCELSGRNGSKLSQLCAEFPSMHPDIISAGAYPLGSENTAKLKAQRSLISNSGSSLLLSTDSPTNTGGGCASDPISRLNYEPSHGSEESEEEAPIEGPVSPGRRVSVFHRLKAERVTDDILFRTGSTEHMCSRKTTSVSGRTRVFRNWLQECLSDMRCDGVVFLLISANALLVGIQANSQVQNGGKENPVYTSIDHVFTTLFTIELSLRLFAEGFYHFFTSKNYSWNFFDFFIVSMSVVDASLTAIFTASSENGGNMTHLRVMRVFRVIRLVRTLRMVRLVRFIRALRALIYSLLVTIKSMVWAMLLLAMILYIFGVAFVQAVGDHYADAQPRDQQFDRFFGSLPKAMCTLFTSITSGLDWGDVLLACQRLGAHWVVLYVFFIIFTYFGVCNAITGVFCQGAIESAQLDKEMVTLQMMANEGAYKTALKEVFKEIDADDSGDITWGEFDIYLREEKCKLYLNSLNISTEDAWSLFRILDVNMTGTLDIDDFVDGCLNLKGPAKAMHFVKLERETKALAAFMEQFAVDLNGLKQLICHGHTRAMSPPGSQMGSRSCPKQKQDKVLSHQVIVPAFEPPPLAVQDIVLETC